MKTAVKIGPKDNGRRMSLAEFDHAEVQEGHLYELCRGAITVSDVPDRRHLAQVTAIRRQFAAYDLRNPGRVYTVASGNECKIMILGLDSERHPDLAIYKTPPPAEEDLWTTWIPEIVVEVVSPSSRLRDYVEKREEYLHFGIREYWIVAAETQEVLVLRRSNQDWVQKTVRPPQIYRTRLLPGFAFDGAPVFQAAEAVAERD